MNIQARPSPFVLTSTAHGTIIVNRNDQNIVDPTNNRGYGMAFQLFNNGCYDPEEIDVALQMLDLRRKHFGDGVETLDCGANIGIHTVEWARHMTGWGEVTGIEAQERLFYALAGNIAINNCFNAHVVNAAVGSECGTIAIPQVNYHKASSFGSFELRKRANTEHIGQDVDYENNMVTIPLVAIDSFGLQRIDFIKVDVEGMEIDVLLGGEQTIRQFKPMMMLEIIKTDREVLLTLLEDWGYRTFAFGLNVIACHETDPSLSAFGTLQAMPSQRRLGEIAASAADLVEKQ